MHGRPIQLVGGRGIGNPHGIVVRVDCVWEHEMQHVICIEHQAYCVQDTIASFPGHVMVWERG